MVRNITVEFLKQLFMLSAAEICHGTCIHTYIEWMGVNISDVENLNSASDVGFES